MAIPQPPQTTAYPEAPQRGESEAVFIPKSNAFVAALDPRRIELQSLADYTYARAVDVETLNAQSVQAAADAVDAAQLAAVNSRIFTTVQDGLDNSTEGEYFSVPGPDADDYLTLYRVVSGAATVIDTYPNKQAVIDVLASVFAELSSNATGSGSDDVAHTGTTDTVTQALNKRTIYVGSVAELEAHPSSIEGQEALVKGCPFIYTAGSWEPSSGYVTPEAFGAVGDGLTDDTAAFQAAVNAHSHVRVIGRKTYLINPRNTFIQNPGDDYYAGVNLPSGCHLDMDPEVTLTIPAQSESWYGVIGCQDAENVRITGGILVGDRDTNTSASGEHGYGVCIISSRDVTVERVTAVGFYGDGFFVGPANHLDASSRAVDVSFIDCIADNNRRQGLSSTGCVRLTVRGGRYLNTNGTPPESGIDLEPNAPETLNEDCLITGVEFSGNAHSGVMLTSNRITRITDCTFRDNQRGHLYVSSGNDLKVRGCTFSGAGAVLRLAEGSVTSERNVDISESLVTLEEVGVYPAEARLFVHVGSTYTHAGTVNFRRNKVVRGGDTSFGIIRCDPDKGRFVFSDNEVIHLPSFVGPSFLALVGGGTTTITRNKFINLGVTELIPSINSLTNFTRFSGGNDYEGPFDRDHIYFKHFGDFQVFIDTAARAAGSIFTRNVSVTGARLGDTVRITPLASVGVGSIYARVDADDSIEVVFYNFTSTIQNYSGDYTITLSRST